MRDAGTIWVTDYTTRPAQIRDLLIRTRLQQRLKDVTTILIKPNLVEVLQPPITTPVSLVSGLIRALRTFSDARIVIAEGSGALEYQTGHVFAELGYGEAARELGVELMDLNEAELVCLEDPTCRQWPRMYLPGIAMESFLISVPVLKAHTLAGVTLTMKNMMGLLSPAHYCAGSWKKSAFHDRIHASVADLNRYRTPDFTLLDAGVGMARAHLWGPACDPPVNRLAAGYDPVAVDSYGAGLLGRDWQKIGHISATHTELGLATPLDIREV